MNGRIRMWNRLRQALARHRGWLSRVLGRIAAKQEEDEKSSRWANEGRARFWAELREGQREAEARSRLRP